MPAKMFVMYNHPTDPAAFAAAGFRPTSSGLRFYAPPR